MPAAQIRLTFQQLKLQIETYQEMKGFNGAFDRFLGYYYQQWISGARHVHKQIIEKISYCDRRINFQNDLLFVYLGKSRNYFSIQKQASHKQLHGKPESVDERANYGS